MSTKTEDKLNQTWTESLFTKTLLAGVTLITAALNLIIAIINLLQGKNIIVIISTVGCIIFLMVSIILFSLRTVQKNSGIKSKRDYENFVTKISGLTHNLLHRVRNSIYYMEDAYNNKQFETARDFEQYVTLEILQLVDSLAIELSKIIGSDIRACIKCLKYTALNEEDINKMNLVTFARSGLKNIDEIMQEHLQPISIEENTDFSDIVQYSENSRQRQYFYEKNLKDFDEKLKKEGKQYKNSNIAWVNDYITTIVCPIRLRRRTSNSEEAMLKYDLIGFLCVDSLNEEAFCNEYSDFCFDLLKGMADILYVYLDRFIEYYSDIKEEIENHA